MSGFKSLPGKLPSAPLRARAEPLNRFLSNSTYELCAHELEAITNPQQLFKNDGTDNMHFRNRYHIRKRMVDFLRSPERRYVEGFVLMAARKALRLSRDPSPNVCDDELSDTLKAIQKQVASYYVNGKKIYDTKAKISAAATAEAKFGIDEAVRSIFKKRSREDDTDAERARKKHMPEGSFTSSPTPTPTPEEGGAGTKSESTVPSPAESSSQPKANEPVDSMDGKGQDTEDAKEPKQGPEEPAPTGSSSPPEDNSASKNKPPPCKFAAFCASTRLTCSKSPPCDVENILPNLRNGKLQDFFTGLGPMPEGDRAAHLAAAASRDATCWFSNKFYERSEGYTLLSDENPPSDYFRTFWGVQSFRKAAKEISDTVEQDRSSSQCRPSTDAREDFVPSSSAAAAASPGSDDTVPVTAACSPYPSPPQTPQSPVFSTTSNDPPSPLTPSTPVSPTTSSHRCLKKRFVSDRSHPYKRDSSTKPRRSPRSSFSNILSNQGQIFDDASTFIGSPQVSGPRSPSEPMLETPVTVPVPTIVAQPTPQLAPHSAPLAACPTTFEPMQPFGFQQVAQPPQQTLDEYMALEPACERNNDKEQGKAQHKHTAKGGGNAGSTSAGKRSFGQSTIKVSVPNTSHAVDATAIRATNTAIMQGASETTSATQNVNVGGHGATPVTDHDLDRFANLTSRFNPKSYCGINKLFNELIQAARGKNLKLDQVRAPMASTPKLVSSMPAYTKRHDPGCLNWQLKYRAPNDVRNLCYEDVLANLKEKVKDMWRDTESDQWVDLLTLALQSGVHPRDLFTQNELGEEWYRNTVLGEKFATEDHDLYGNQFLYPGEGLAFPPDDEEKKKEPAEPVIDNKYFDDLHYYKHMRPEAADARAVFLFEEIRQRNLFSLLQEVNTEGFTGEPGNDLNADKLLDDMETSTDDLHAAIEQSGYLWTGRRKALCGLFDMIHHARAAIENDMIAEEDCRTPQSRADYEFFFNTMEVLVAHRFPRCTKFGVFSDIEDPKGLTVIDCEEYAARMRGAKGWVFHSPPPSACQSMSEISCTAALQPWQRKSQKYSYRQSLRKNRRKVAPRSVARRARDANTAMET
ncbi:hypothetical protein LTR05_006814 [Lithohypha guttulata]|uniref:Uncharacterized protein n=1 Tax=Lithohypha guttulata TaxID=1690604 RepID=A0AAN7SVW2_9EURO|nr:hypothetical protein LTR05_006814 [Lithohypha guttulata]